MSVEQRLASISGEDSFEAGSEVAGPWLQRILWFSGTEAGVRSSRYSFI